MGYVFQNPDDQIFKYNVMDEIMFGPMNIGMDPKRAEEEAKRALELLKTTDYEKALVKAAELKALNDERKSMTDDGVQQALDQIENSHMKGDRVLVIYLPDCHESLAGIIAGRIRERYYRPVFVLTRSLDGVKGSGRSIETYSMFEEMSKCKELYTKYGGHPMAAGLSLAISDIDIFRKC